MSPHSISEPRGSSTEARVSGTTVADLREDIPNLSLIRIESVA